MSIVWLVAIGALVICVCVIALALNVGTLITNASSNKDYRINIALIVVMIICIIFNSIIIITNILKEA
jgi:hypothetical protein